MEFLRRLLPLAGRILLALIFLGSGFNKITGWSGTAAYMANEGMPLVPLLLAGAIAFELGGGLSLVLGFKTRIGALLLVVFLIPTTVIFHDFWTVEDPIQHEVQMIGFMKNLSIMGGLLFVMGMGPGPWALDNRRAGGAMLRTPKA